MDNKPEKNYSAKNRYLKNLWIKDHLINLIILMIQVFKYHISARGFFSTLCLLYVN